MKWLNKYSAGWLALMLVVVSAALVLRDGESVRAQELITATPIPVVLVTPTPAAVESGGGLGVLPSATWTATTPPLAALEPLNEANVRAEADINSEVLGQIRAGERYTVTGRQFQWYQFIYENSPNGRGWVFGELVTIIGDPALIPEVTAEPLPTTDPLVVGATQTLEVLLQLPGGPETATAAARGVVATLEIPGVSSIARATDAPSGPALPTFTYPPGIVRITPVPAQVVNEAPVEINAETLTNLPPLVPILVLGTLGVLGLALSGRGRK